MINEQCYNKLCTIENVEIDVNAINIECTLPGIDEFLIYFVHKIFLLLFE